ncbi:44662_t:CDS:1, partial [Gigaspora margarita]
NKIYGNNGIFELFIAGDRYIIITKPEYARKFLAPSSKDRKIYWKRFPTVGLLKELNLDEKGLALNTNFDKWK